MNLDTLKTLMCRTFCAEISVHEVPAGLAFSGMFEDSLGDRITGFLVQDRGAPYLADDGSFVADLEASGVQVFEGARAMFLERVLGPAGAYVDPDTMEIRTNSLDRDPDPEVLINFLSALARVRDVSYWSQERVRSTFVEDAVRAMRDRFNGAATVVTDAAIDSRFADFPADAIIRPHGAGRVVAVFLVQTTDKLTEAMALAQELRLQKDNESRVAALVEDSNSIPMQSRKAQRAINRISAFAFYRGDENAALDRLAATAELRSAA